MLSVLLGGNSGIGYETALELAKRGAEIILASRNAEKVRSQKLFDFTSQFFLR
jgi:NAD(P)-dependent dehydrogenase (short-subunit alcohol dehydrogenase family)